MKDIVWKVLAFDVSHSLAYRTLEIWIAEWYNAGQWAG
jgi:hypothetical protein